MSQPNRNSRSASGGQSEQQAQEESQPRSSSSSSPLSSSAARSGASSNQHGPSLLGRQQSGSMDDSYNSESEYTSDQSVAYDDEASQDAERRRHHRHHHHHHHRTQRQPPTRPSEDLVTIRGRQGVINDWHMFGFRPWKSALYKKSRSVTRAAFMALHSQPDRSLRIYRNPGNILWLVLFGWWMALACLPLGALLYAVPYGGQDYARVVFGLASYLLWPFGRSVERIKVKLNNNDPETPNTAPLRAGRNYGHEVVALLASPQRTAGHPRSRFTGIGRAMYYLVFLCALNPLLLLVSAVMWACVFTIPMGKLTFTLSRYLWRDPLSLHFSSMDTGEHQQREEEEGEEEEESDDQETASAGNGGAGGSRRNYYPSPTTLLCTNKAMGLYYYKYTIDGVNILLIDLLFVSVYVLCDVYIFKRFTADGQSLTPPRILFMLCLISTMPLAYIIGQAVSSISAQSSLGMGAVINATFGSIVEIILYCIALQEGKALLVEGALIGSFLSGMLLMPGTSMIAGGMIFKEQRFNAKSAGVTATLIIMSIIGAFAPTLFYQTFGSWELHCTGSISTVPSSSAEFVRCTQKQPLALDDPFYQETVRPFMYLCAAILPTAYLIGMWFTLRTHVKQIYAPPQRLSTALRNASRSIISSIIPEVIRHVLPIRGGVAAVPPLSSGSGAAHPSSMATTGAEARVPPNATPRMRRYRFHHHQNQHRHVTPSSHTVDVGQPFIPDVPPLSELPLIPAADPDDLPPDFELLLNAADNAAPSGEGGGDGGHDAPNWGKVKSATILCGCTVIFALIAEVLVHTVDVVINDLGIPEKLIGLTLFAIVPNATEFLNAIAFATRNNIALSIEIGNAYTVQVSLLQIPALVAFSAIFGSDPVAKGLSDYLSFLRVGPNKDLSNYIFTLIFPRWDVITVLFSVFLLTYMLIEGKANYFKGSILCLSYLVWIISYFFELL